MVYIFHNLFLFAKVCSNVISDFNNRNQFLTAKLLDKAIGIINCIKYFLQTLRDEY